MDEFVKKLGKLSEVDSDQLVKRDEVMEVFNALVSIVKDIHSQYTGSYESLMRDVKGNSAKEIREMIKEEAERLKENVNRSMSEAKDNMSMDIVDIRDTIKRLPKPEKLDKESLIKETLARGKFDEDIVDKLNKSSKKLDFTKIAGFEALQSKVIELDFNSRSRGSGGGSTIRILNNGTPVGDTISELNFTNATTSHTGGTTGRRVNVSVSASNGLSKLTATGTVNGSNTAFTFSTEPSILFVDGVPKQKVSTDSTVNWTGTTSVTLTVAPTFDIFGL